MDQLILVALPPFVVTISIDPQRTLDPEPPRGKRVP
jgi:hypothetical protein